LTWKGIAEETEGLIWEVASQFGVSTVAFQGKICHLEPPWQRLAVDEAFQTYAGWTPSERFDEDRFYFDLVDKVDPHLGIGTPTILFDYPAPLSMLSKISPENPRIAQRFEIYLSGVEIANAFEELTDPVEQRRRFEEDLLKRKLLNKPHHPIDEKLLAVLQDMPPCSGIAVGVDRLVMLLTGAKTVKEVIAFPEEEL